MFYQEQNVRQAYYHASVIQTHAQLQVKESVFERQQGSKRVQTLHLSARAAVALTMQVLRCLQA